MAALQRPIALPSTGQLSERDLYRHNDVPELRQPTSPAPDAERLVHGNGAHAKWHVEGHVKKVAFFRQTNPFWLGLAVRGVNKLKRMLFAPGEHRPPRLVDAG